MALGGRLILGLALACGCAGVERARLPAEISDGVVLAAQEPGPACCALERVEVRSRRAEAPAADALRLYAWRRSANYVVLDAFAVLDETSDDQVLMRARLYRCPALVRVQ
jgi:hypothetical protein